LVNKWLKIGLFIWFGFRSSYQHSKKIAASARTIFEGGVVAPFKTVGNDLALWLASVGEGFGKLQYRYILP
jgi:hypothetical protein